MFSFFNKKFFNTPPGHQNTIEMKAPNGGIYRFSTNTMDQETFNKYAKQLEEATRNNDQESFDRIWNELQQQSGFIDIHEEFSRLHQEMRSFLEDTSSFFSRRNSLLSDFFGPKLLTSNAIDEQIKHHEQEIKRLQELKNNQSTLTRKEELRNEINMLKEKLDIKLQEYGKNLDNERMKKMINDELVEINRKIKQLEQEYNSL